MLAESAVDFLLQQIPELAGGIYLDVLPQGYSIPAARYWRVSTDVEEDLGGPIGLDHCRFQVEVCDTSRLQSLRLAIKVRKKLSRFRGNAGEVFVSGIQIASGPRSTRIPPTNASDQTKFVTAQDFMFHCVENDGT